MTFRCSLKARDRLRLTRGGLVEPPEVVEATDWYCHLLTIDRRPVWLVTHALSLYTVVFPATGVSTPSNLATAVRQEVRAALAREGYPDEAAERIVGEGADQFCKATDRRVIGSMNDFANMAFCDGDGIQSADPVVLQRIADGPINGAPMSVLHMERPRAVLRLLLLPRGNA